MLANVRWRRYYYLKRKEFLNYLSKYLFINTKFSNLSIKYLDLNKKDNILANIILDNKNTFKDKFWKSYYRPNIRIKRDEAVFMLSRTLEKNKDFLLTIK